MFESQKAGNGAQYDEEVLGKGPLYQQGGNEVNEPTDTLVEASQYEDEHGGMNKQVAEGGIDQGTEETADRGEVEIAHCCLDKNMAADIELVGIDISKPVMIVKMRTTVCHSNPDLVKLGSGEVFSFLQG